MVEKKNIFRSFPLNISRLTRQSILFLYSIFRNILHQKSIITLISTYFIYLYYHYSDTQIESTPKVSLSRKFSNIIKFLTRIYIPKLLRKPIFYTYGRIFDINFDEILENITKFKNFNEFFTRQIKIRDIANCELVSPADGKILSFSEVKTDECLLIKGRNYRLGELLTGEKDYKFSVESLNKLKKNPANKLYQCVFYLSPGDYHRFHSPADMIVEIRNHIVGYLLPVKESYILKNDRVYEVNERVVLFGEWKFGFLATVLVGALNVGTISLNFDKELSTNTNLKKNFEKTNIKNYRTNKTESTLNFLFEKPMENDSIKKKNRKNRFSSVFPQKKDGISVKKGDEFGRFNMGSTIVLVFEAGHNFEMTAQIGQRILYGESIGTHSE